MFCGQCGAELDNAAKFCTWCGNQTSFKSEKKTVNNRKSSASSFLYQAKYMSFTEAVGVCYSKFFEFSGRASRSEYWWFYLFTLLLTWGTKLVAIITMPDNQIGLYAGVILESVVILATVFPFHATWVRRLHDIGKSGWNILWAFTIVGIIPLIIWACREGDKKQNEFDTKKSNSTLAVAMVFFSILLLILITFFQANKEFSNELSVLESKTKVKQHFKQLQKNLPQEENYEKFDKSLQAQVEKNDTPEIQMKSEPIVNKIKSQVSSFFEIQKINHDFAQLNFINPEGKLETFKVYKSSNETIESAVVKKIIERIRQDYSAEFNWKSNRLGRTVVLTASLEEDTGLQNFLFEEFFGSQ
jgi:uncharacterized membrane protein YhaH (DUF805 family)